MNVRAAWTTVFIVLGLNLATPGLMFWAEWVRLGHRPPWTGLLVVVVWQAGVAVCTVWAAWSLVQHRRKARSRREALAGYLDRRKTERED